MFKFTIVKYDSKDITFCGGFNTIEEAITNLQDKHLADWVGGKIFIVENIPLKIVVG